MIPQRKQRNSTRVNLIVSLAFHSIIVIALYLFAAREGMLGKQLKKIAVTMWDTEPNPATRAAVKAIVEDFQKIHKDVEIRAEGMGWGENVAAGQRTPDAVRRCDDWAAHRNGRPEQPCAEHRA